MRRGLPKKYAKMGFKKGWREYKKTLRKPVRTTSRKTYSKPRKRGKTMAKRKRTYRKRASNMLTSKTAIDGYIAAGGKMVAHKVVGNAPMIDAAIDIGVGLFRKNNTLTAQGIVGAVTAYIPSLNMGGNGINKYLGG